MNDNIKSHFSQKSTWNSSKSDIDWAIDNVKWNQSSSNCLKFLIILLLGFWEIWHLLVTVKRFIEQFCHIHLYECTWQNCSDFFNSPCVKKKIQSIALQNVLVNQCNFIKVYRRGSQEIIEVVECIWVRENSCTSLLASVLFN